MNIWGIHMGVHVGSTPIDEAYIGIGWPEIGDLEELKRSRVAFKAGLEKAYPATKPGAVPVQAGVLYRFVYEINEGDYVVYPSKSDRMVNIGRVTGGYLYLPENIFGYPNQRKVEWIDSFPRSDFSQTALHEIGSALTLFQVRNHSNEFLQKISQDEGKKAAQPNDKEDDESAIQSASKQAEESTEDFIIRRLLSELDPYEFEEFTAHLLERMGYKARVSQKSGDGGVDVIAHKDELGFEPPIVKVQCKQITASTGSPDVNQLLGTLGEGEYGLFVNLGSYTREARNLERNKSKLRLIDGDELVDLVLENYPSFSRKYREVLPLKQIYVPDLN